MRARKNRQNRKQTQPVPADLMEQISKHKELDMSSSQLLGSDADQDSTSDSNPTSSTGENSPAESRRRTLSSSKVSGDVPDGPVGQTGKARSSSTSKMASSDSADATKSQSGKGTSDDTESRPIMSSYKPRNRPSSKILNAVSLVQKENADNPPSPKMANVVDQKMKAEAAVKSHGNHPIISHLVLKNRACVCMYVFICVTVVSIWKIYNRTSPLPLPLPSRTKNNLGPRLSVRKLKGCLL